MDTPTHPAVAAAYEELVASHRPALERLARRLARDPHDAEDLLQESLLDAYRAFSRFRPDSHFYSWVARIMTNNHLDRVRRKRHPQVSLEGSREEEGEALELPDRQGTPEEVLLQSELDAPFHTALEALQPLHRAAVELCDLGDATYEEAAQAERCPVGTIRSRLHRAHKALRGFLAGLEAPAAPPTPTPLAVASRRRFLLGSVAAAGMAVAHLNGAEDTDAAEPPEVLVWVDGEASPAAYPGGIGGAIAAALGEERRYRIRLGSSDEPDARRALRTADVLVWWSGAARAALPGAMAAAIRRRVRDEGMGLIVLHAGGAGEALRHLLSNEATERATPTVRTGPAELRITAPCHPIARSLSAFRVAAAPRGEVLAGIQPDVVVLAAADERGNEGRQGMVWTVGRGRVFYFRPGDPEHPVFRQEEVRQVLRNAVGWCVAA